MKHDFKNICGKFNIYGDFIKASPFGSGHINGTYKVIYSQAGTIVPYIIQSINSDIFKDPYSLMENVVRVIDHVKEKSINKTKKLSSRVLSLVPMKHGGYLYQDENDNYWRCFFCIEDMATYDVLESEEMAYEGARAIGKFQYQLSDFPKPRLHDTIPDFHNTPKRYQTFIDDVEKDVAGRVKDVESEISRLMEYKKYASKIYDLYEENLIPERVCHNDTKLNNVMIDNDTGEGKCVIDLDTVMPGFVPYDFGDLMRTGVCFAAEDETDLSKVVINMGMFSAIARGYLVEANKFLTKDEKESLVLGGIIITLELAVRFLNDHINGDKYFKIHRENHNLDRARAQLKLVDEMVNNYDELCAIVNNCK